MERDLNLSKPQAEILESILQDGSYWLQICDFQYITIARKNCHSVFQPRNVFTFAM